jgi:hypothetical protein
MALSAAGAAALAAGGKSASASAGSIDQVRNSALRYFTDRGYQEIPPLDLITGDDFNGGIRYDDTRPGQAAVKTVSVQYAARTDDVADRGRPGVLAGFNIIVFQDPGAETPGSLIEQVMEILVSDQGLDPDRMMFVSTEVFRPVAERIDTVNPDRIFERPLAEAREAGDGSGYFAPKGHPLHPASDSVAIYYPLPGEGSEPSTAYPPSGYFEIAEIGLSREYKIGAIGLERLAIAKGVPAPSFKDTQQELLRALEMESESRGKPLPPGYAVFASL